MKILRLTQTNLLDNNDDRRQLLRSLDEPDLILIKHKSKFCVMTAAFFEQKME